jgi:pimeloyl-ACP methyl ester carboxylesterase
MGQEYIRSHRAFLQLARLLSSTGFHVLRFDFYGCGDSEGDFSQGSIKQWIADVSVAVDEMRGRCDADRICLIGLRLGGALAVMAGAERGDIESIALWNPVVEGRAYLEELASLHEQWLYGSFAKPRLNSKGRNNHEVLGFLLTDSMTGELQSIDLLRLQEKPAKKMYIVESSLVTGSEHLKKHLMSMSVELGYEHVPASKIWIKSDDESNKGLVPMAVLQKIAAWVSEAF